METRICLTKKVISLFFERLVNKSKIDQIKCKGNTQKNFNEI